MYKKLIFHIPVMVFLAVVIFIISSVNDWFEEIHDYIERYENYNLDEIFLVIVALLTYLLIVLFVLSIKNFRKSKVVHKLTNELHQENKTKAMYHAIIAHDLKSPFNSLIGISDLLLEFPEKLKTQEGIEAIDLINSTSKKSYVLLENLLHWSLIQHKEIKAFKQKVCLNGVIEEVYDELKSILKSKHLHVSMDICDNTCAYVDENMLRVILRNFISNAIKYSPENSDIKIVMQKTGLIITVKVIDKGVGLTKEQIALLTEGKLKSTPGTQNEKGTGFGLDVSKEFIAQSNGEFFIESEPNKGSIFSFTLPVYQEQDKKIKETA